MSEILLRPWQQEALAAWNTQSGRGIIEVVTGGGKTIFALAAIQSTNAKTTLIVVPTVALLDQWWAEVAAFFDISLDDINVIGRENGLRRGMINLAVLNTASKIDGEVDVLVVDECHKAASVKFRNVLDVVATYRLGLSATPERQYDTFFEDVLVPKIGPVIFRYTYKDALRDGVIVPFTLRNVVFDLEPEVQADYDKLTKAIGRSVSAHGAEAPETVNLYLRRARILNLSVTRIQLAVRLVARHIDRRILVFHEDIQACEIIWQALSENGVPAGIYHSKMPVRERATVLANFRKGRTSVLVTCRALDEGFNVPETEIGIIAASTATQRQRIQRLGRILRPSQGKTAAEIYTLVASVPEIERLRKEETDLEGVASVTWGKA